MNISAVRGYAVASDHAYAASSDFPLRSETKPTDGSRITRLFFIFLFSNGDADNMNDRKRSDHYCTAAD